MPPSAETTPAEEARYAELQLLALDAARTGNGGQLLPMLDAGLPICLADERGNSLLMLASYHGYHDLARELLERGADPEQRNDRNQTTLAGVAFKGDLGIAKLLVKYGADPDADQGGGRYPIHFAAMFGNSDIVEFFQSLKASQGGAWRLRMLSGMTGLIRKCIRPFLIV
jgi:ankyrin repeat protein